MLQTVENTIMEFFDRFDVRTSKIDKETAVKLLASQIYLNHIQSEATPVTKQLRKGLVENAVIEPKRRGRTQKVNKAEINKAETNQVETAVVEQKRRGRPQSVNISKKSRGVAKAKGTV